MPKMDCLKRRTDGNASFLRAARAGNLDKVLEYLKGSTDINTSNANGLNALHLASKEGHVNIVTELLKRGANVDAATKKGNTALHIASLAGQEEIVKILVQHGAKVNVQSQNGFTPLYMASQENHAEVVKFLLANGASQGLATEDGFTPLAVALQQGHDKVVAVLLENDSRGKVRLPALHIAAKKDDVKAATLLLQNEHNIDGTSKSGFTPLHIASHYGNMNVGTLLIEKEADVNFKARNSILPLHVASKWGRTNMVTLLLDNGGLIDGKTRDGLSPLHCGARSGHEQVVDLLLERGANVCSKTKNGLSPLHMAAQGDHVDCARLLLYHKAPIDDVTVDYLTPLHVAAHCGNVRTAKLLLDRKCEVNARALNGFTPLHIACKKNRIKVVELLLKYGASIEATTESGLTPLHVASFMGHMNIVVYLLQHGANPDTPTVRGETALHLAARANQTDIIRILLRNGATVDAKAREQQTPLHIASRLGNENNVVLLLQHGASPDATTKDLYTPLHIAAKEGHEEVAAALLDHAASQNLTTKKGFTPLHIAAKYGNIKVVKLLLQKEADPNVQGKNGLTPLHVATHYNHVNVAMMLLENGASPHCTAKNGYTPLHIAAKKNQMDIASTLLEYGAKPNAESKNGFTPLHLAAQEGHVDMVSLLLEHEADVNCRAKNGLTPMHLAAQEDKVPVAEVLIKYSAEIDTQTKAGYTPLHTACHFGQINMIRFLLEQGASVNTTTKLGYTPLHQAAQQGHVLVINLLLKYKASPNAVTNTGQTPLSIAQRLGYISVVEILKHITEVQVPQPGAQDEKYKVVSPETMQETLMTDSEDEGELLPSGPVYLPYYEGHKIAPERKSGSAQDWGEDTILGDQSMSIDDMKFLGDDSITPIRSQDEYYLAERYSTTTASTLGGQDDFRSHFLDDSDIGPVFDDQVTYRTHRPEEKFRVSSERTSGAYERTSGVYEQTSSAYETTATFERTSGDFEQQQEEKLQQTLAPAPPMLAKPGGSMEESRAMYGSYSGASFASSFDPDNVALDRHPIYSGFLVSFMVDARGGAMRGCRHSGVRIIVPPGKACMPTRVTCKLVKKEKLSHPPPMMEGEALASRILEMGPVGAKFLGPVILEVPHFAALRGKEREIVILRSDNGETWREHTMEATEEALQEALNGSFEGEDLESAEELYSKRITRVLTTEFPNYFAVVTRIKQETKSIGPESGMLSSTVVPQVQAVFPEGSLTKKIKVGLQAQPIPPELVSKMLGNRVAVSPIVTVEPRRRKFHKPITLTIPLPKASQKGMTNPLSSETPTLRLLCSITGGTSPAQWEDITGTTPLTFVNDCVSFTTTVSARFWLMDCQNINEAAKMATELYRDTIAVPFMAKFVVFAKSHENMESRLRVFCMTDDKMDKTLESQEQFIEIARSKDVEVLEGKAQYLEMAGNLVPVTKSGDQLYINFHAFRENRLPFIVRIRDSNQEVVGRLAFMKEPKVGRGEAPQTPICNLNIRLPDTYERGEGHADMDPDLQAELRRKYELARGIRIENQSGYGSELVSSSKTRLTYVSTEEDQISKAELRLTDIADALQGDWVVLAQQLEVTDEEIAKIQSEYTYVSEQSLVMLHLWVQKNAEQATGNSLERALRKIGREDVIRKCMYNIEEVTDAVEKAVAKVHIDQPGFDAMKEELGTSADSSIHRGLSLDVSYDEQDIMKESESVEGSETGSIKEQRPGSLEDYIIPEVDERHGVIRSPTDEEERDVSEQKHQAYMDLALQLEETEPQELVQPPSPVQDGDMIIEAEIREVRKSPEPVVPMQDLIQKVEVAEVHGMDDRRASFSSEEDFKDGVLGKQAKAKTKTPPPSPTSEDQGQEQDMNEAVLAGRLAQVETLRDTVEPGQARLDSQEHKMPPAQQVAREEVIQKSAVTKTRAEFAEPTFEDWVQQREIQAPAPHLHDQDIDEIELYAAPATGEDLAPEGRTFEDWVASKELKPSEQVSIEPAGEIRKDVISVQEYDETQADGSVVHHKITVTEHVQPIVEKTVLAGVEKIRRTERKIGTEVEDSTTEIAPGVVNIDDENVVSETATEDEEDTLPDGTWERRKIIITRIKCVEPPSQVKDSPVLDVRKVPYGDIQKKVTSLQEYDEELPDGTTVHRKITVTDHVQPYERTTVGDGFERTRISEERVGREIEEAITEIPPGVKDLNAANVEKQTSVEAAEDTLPDGTWEIKRFVNTKITLLKAQEAPLEEKYSPREPTKLDAFEEFAPATLQSKQLTAQEIQKYESGEVKKNIASVQEFDETLPDGTHVHRKVTVIEHVQQIANIKIVAGIETSERNEETVGIEIEELVTELAPGVSPDDKNVESVTSVEDKSSTLSDGTWQKIKIVTTRISPSPVEKIEGKRPVGMPRPQVVSVNDYTETLPNGNTISRHITVTEQIQPFEETVRKGSAVTYRTTEEKIGKDIVEDVTDLAPGIRSPNQQGTEAERSVQDSEETMPDGTWQKTKVITTTVRPVKSQAPPTEETVSPLEAQREFLEQAALLSIRPEDIGEERTPAGPTKTHVASVKDSAETLPDGTTVTRKVTITEHVQPFASKSIEAGYIRLKTTEEKVGTEIEEDVTEMAPGIRSPNQEGTEAERSVQDSEETMPDGTWQKTKVITTTVRPVKSQAPPSEETVSPIEAQREFLEQAAQLSIRPEDIREERTPAGPTRTHVASVKDFAETLPDGTTVTRKVTITEHIQPFAQKSIEAGVIRLKTTEEKVGTEIEEDVTQMAPGIRSPNQEGTEAERSVQDSEETMPDGTWQKTKVITTTVRSVIPQVIPAEDAVSHEAQREYLEQHAAVAIEPEEEGKTPTGPARTHVASVKEFSETLPDGTNITRIVTVTEHIQQFSQKFVEGNVVRIRTTEEKIGRDILEDVTELGPGVDTAGQSDAEASKSENDSEKTLSDGTWEKTKVVTTKVRLNAEAEAQYLADRQKQSPLLTEPIEDLKEGKYPTGDPRIHIASVRETEETLPDGVTIRRKFTEKKHIQAFTTKTIEGDQIRVRTAEEIIGTEIEENITKMGPGVSDPNQEHTNSETSEDKSEDTLPDGTWLRKNVITTTIKLDKAFAPAVDTSTGKKPHGEPRTHTASIKEFEERLPDGTLVHRRVTIIQHIQAFQQRVEEEGFIKVRTAEEVIGTEIQENRTEMAPGVRSQDQQNTNSVTTEDESEEMQSDGTWQKTKTTTTKITLKSPVEQKPKITMEAKKPQQFPPEGFDGDYEEEEYEETLPDGSLVHKRVITLRTGTTIIRKIITENEDGEISEEIISEDISGAELKPPTKEREQSASDQQFVKMSVHEEMIQSEVTSSAAAGPGPSPVMEMPVTEDDIMGVQQAPVERRPDFDEVEEVLPDGTTVKRKILKTRVKKTVTKKIRRIGPDGEVIEDVITEEIPESELSDTSSLRSSLSEARDVYSPVPSMSSPGELASPAESDSERPSVRVYTDTIEGEPQIETDVQEFEETLPDGSIIKRKVIKTRQKQTIIKRVVMEGPEDDLPASDEQAQLMLSNEGLPDYPDLKVYTDHAETEPETSTDVQEFEETLEDGTIVKKKVVTKTEQQMKTERTVMEGQGHIPGLTDTDDLAALEAELAVAEREAEAAEHDLIHAEKMSEVQSTAFEEDIVPDVQTRSVIPHAGPSQPQPQMSMEEEIVQEVVEGVEASPLSGKSPVLEDEVIPVSRDSQQPELVSEDKLQSVQKASTESAPVVEIPDDQAHLEDMLTSPASIASDGTLEFEDAQEELLTTEDGQLEEAAGGDMATTRVVMRKQVHKKTVIRDGKEETVVTEDTHVEQDNEGPEELRDSMQQLIDQFMEGSGEVPRDPPVQQ